MGGSGAKLGGSTTPNSNQNVSPTSTGGKIVDQGSGQWYGENDRGYSVSILDGGKDDINMYRYGSRQIYEVSKYRPDGSRYSEKEIFTTKKEAMDNAKFWIKNVS